MMKIFVSIIMIITLVGCVSTTKKLPELGSSKSMVLVSALESDLRIYHVGTTAFNNELSSIDASDLELNDYVSTIVADELRSKRGFIVKKAEDPTYIEQAKDVHTLMETPVWDISSQKGVIKNIARESNSEFVGIIKHRGYQDVIFDTTQELYGFGIYQREFLGVKDSVDYGTLQIIIFDGESGEELGFAVELMHESRREAEWSDDFKFSGGNITETKSKIKKIYLNLTRSLLEKLNVS